MFKPTSVSILVLALAFGLVTASVENNPPQLIKAKLVVVPDIATFKATHPELDVVPLNATKSNRSQIVYTVGQRLPGDQLVSTTQDYSSSDTLQDVALYLRYPESGTGAVVTFVEIVVNQSSNQGHAHIVSGGVGEHFIELVVEAYGTSYFQYSVQVYGYFSWEIEP
ncbi:uncharacterized protein LOC134220914 [Armigeres subalbatus]|uniref:uncharacterized protein LOC134220914 n=1 Tax=Armigeres subalbatus TaxID=124917 RepID=UPI002ED3C01C